MVAVFAQSASVNFVQVVHKGGDTVVYLAGKRQAGKSMSIYNMLQNLSEFKFNSGRYFIHNGEVVKRIAINGVQYTDLDIDSTIKALPVSMVNAVEINGSLDGFLLCGFGEAPGKLIDISVSKSNINKVSRLLALKQKKRAPTLDELLKKMESLHVNTTGIIMYKGKPVTRIKLLDTAATPKITKVRLYCADIITRIAEQIVAVMNGTTEPNTDDYGDQIPHFLIQPKAGTYTSKATRY